MKVEIKKHEIRTVHTQDDEGQPLVITLETPGEIYVVTLVNPPEGDKVGGTWDETFGSRSEVERFMRGVQAGRAMSGQMMPLNYEIPR
jgi:hypothetical protein